MSVQMKEMSTYWSVEGGMWENILPEHGLRV